LPVGYKEVHLELGFRIDLIVNDLVIIEVKSVEMLHDVHKKQLLTYLKLSKRKIGFLVNFNSCFLDKQSFIRIVN
jgi:GxxExxY protein